MENLNERDAEAIIDDLLKNKGWNGNPCDEQRNITRQNVFNEYKKQMGRKFPDYVFYDASRSPLCILEVKKPKEKNKNTLDKALEQAKSYAQKINCPLAIASNGFVYTSYHLDFRREYLINNKPLNDLPTPQELTTVHSQYFFNTYRGKVLTNQEEFRRLLKKIDDKLWQEGLKEGDERFTEFCKLLFLRLISRPNDLESSWNKVIAQLKTSDDTITTIINGELEKHREHYKIDKYISSLNIQSSNIVKTIIKEINEIDFAESDFDAKGVIFEYFLGQRGKDDLAQYFTPRNIVRFMINFLEPKLGETVYDPFCGSGGMLIEAYEFIRKQILFDEKYQENLNFLKTKTLYGNDKASIAYVAKLNMILIGDGHNNIERCDSLKKKLRRECDIVITNIPFNISTEFGNLYSYPTSEANSICVQHIIANLKTTPNARAGIIVPNIFVSGNEFQELRKNIEENFDITVVSLPEGTFQPYTPSNAYILFIKRKQLFNNKQREREREQKSIEYYRVQQIGFTLNKKKEPIPKDDLSDIISGKTTPLKITQENSWTKKNLPTTGIPLSDILETIELGEPIELISTEKYCQLTVLWYGRGIRARTFGGKEFFYGSQIKTKRWVAKKNWLILDKINARKGAFGLILESLDNSLTRKNYAFFKIKEKYNYLNPLFLVAYLTSDEYQDFFDELSHGTAHKLITTKKFLSIKVSLTERDLKLKNLEFTKQKELELELELATVRQKIKEIMKK